ncbi:cation transporter [Lactobacillus sp. PV037]|uniref:cation diffusion facilitator family transporter n=1 Tax=unclassified Lactobacillus TaxID=2620435 RepID=UPI00224032E6|nr:MULTISPECIES: cation diffusion facilitator family transporter [unclassified Lactobacillus]QNQ81851.1 cation transporter [Lactobacillus sp. PV012]QNQ84110.1 cation transporter [Lactobacillus sp. PV037]
MDKKSSLAYFWVTVLNILITVAEFIGGALSGSLALLSDAVHNLSDVGSIILAFVANLIARRKRNESKTFGYERAEILAAFTNGIILIIISIFLLVEGIRRFSHPEVIKSGIMLWVALIGLAANVVSMLIVARDAKKSLNARATFLNMMSDALTSIAVVVGAIIIAIWKVEWIDPVLTIAASLFLLNEAYKVTIKAANILMETNPSIDLNEVSKIILKFPEVKNVHHMHVWQYSEDMTMLDAHINVDGKMDAASLDNLYGEIEEKLKTLGINHVTLQAECIRGKNDAMLAERISEGDDCNEN